MRAKITVLAAGFFMLFSSYKTEAQEELDFGKEASAQILYNFGQIKEGEKINHIFEITNNSPFSWQIKDIFASCGCVLARLIKDKKVEDKEIIKAKEVKNKEAKDKKEVKDRIIVPQETFEVEVDIDTSGHRGELEQFVYLNIAQANEIKILKLVIQAEVIKEQQAF